MKVAINENALNKLGVTQVTDSFGRRSFRPQGRQQHIAPVIIEEYYEEEVDQDTGQSYFSRMYECEPHPGETTPRIFIADKYDAMFIPVHDKRLVGRKTTNKTK